MKHKLKVIHVANYSHSIISKNIEEDIYKRDWNVRFARQFKKYHPEIEIEVWNIEKKYEKVVEKFDRGIMFKTFPTSLSIMFSKEVSFRMIKELEKEIERCKIKNIKLILHLHDYHNWNSYLICKKFGRKISIFAQHHGGKFPLSHLKKYKFLYLLYPVLLTEQSIEKNSISKIKKIYYLTDEEKRYLSRVLKNKLDFQTMGVDENFLKPLNKRKIKEELGLENYKKIILFVGRISKNKGINYLLRGVSKFLKGDKKNCMVFVGEGNLISEIQRFSKKKGFENQILVKGRQSPEQTVKYYNSADIFILPSLNEGAPVTLMESLLCKTPVISTKVGSVDLMIRKNEGIIIKSKNEKEIERAINYFFDNIKKFSINRSEVVERFSWKKIIEKTYRDYLKLNNIKLNIKNI